MDRPMAYGWAEKISANVPEGFTARCIDDGSTFGLRITLPGDESPPYILAWDHESCRALHILLSRFAELED